MLIDAVVSQLKECGHPLFLDDNGCMKIAGSMDYGLAKQASAVKPPAIFVIEGPQNRINEPEGGRKRPRKMDWRYQFGVVVWVKPSCYDDDLIGKWGSDAVCPIRGIIFDCLLGWKPGGCYSPLIANDITIGKQAEDFIEIIFEFETDQSIPIRLKHSAPKPVISTNVYALKIGETEINHDPCKEVKCEIISNEGDGEECAEPANGPECDN